MLSKIEGIMWWGYLHQNGTIQVKRWSGDHKDYTDDCYDNDFVVKVVKPFKANSRKEALNIIKETLQLCSNGSIGNVRLN